MVNGLTATSRSFAGPRSQDPASSASAMVVPAPTVPPPKNNSFNPTSSGREPEFPSELYMQWYRLYDIPEHARGKP
jgi:hypothetical protein